MRIAFITTEFLSEAYFAGGIANYLYRVNKLLQKHGHTTHVFVRSSVDEDIEYEGILVHRVAVPSKDVFSSQVEYWLMCSKLLNQRLAQVHQQIPFDVAQYVSWMATAIYRLPYLPTVSRISSLQSLWVRQSSENLELKMNINSPEQSLELLSLEMSDLVYSPSQILADEVKDFLDSPVPIVESPFSVEVQEFDHTVYDEYFANKTYILFFGRLSENKGCVELAEVLAPILEQNPELYFGIIGEHSPYKESTMAEYLRTKAGKYKERVIILPEMRHDKLIPILRQAAIVTLPSRVDNVPNTFLEALGAGKVVVATRGASFDQFIIDGQNGFLAEISDPASLQSKIQEALNLSKHQKSDMEKAVLLTISRLYPEQSIPRLLSIYEETIKIHVQGKGVRQTSVKSTHQSSSKESYPSWMLTQPLRSISQTIKKLFADMRS